MTDLERARALCDEFSETWAMTCEELHHLQELVVQFATTIRAEELERSVKVVKAWRAQKNPHESMHFRAVMRELEQQVMAIAASEGAV